MRYSKHYMKKGNAFFKALKVQPVTKKAICKAFDLNIEAMCRLKRRLEKNGKLKQSKRKLFVSLQGITHT